MSVLEQPLEEQPTCRICLEPGDLIQPCDCKGSSAYVHKECLDRWLKTSKRTNCEICLFEYEIEEEKAPIPFFLIRRAFNSNIFFSESL